jgi:hypothetical protein
MSDEDDYPDPERNKKIISFFEAQQKRDAPQPRDNPPLASNKEAIDWTDKIHACTVTDDGKFRVINERMKDKVIFMDRKQFIDSLENVRIVSMTEGKPTITPVSKLWLEYPQRRTYDKIIFDPQKEYDPKGGAEYNLWRDFVIKPIKGDCHLTMEYINDIISNKKSDMNNHVFDFLAHMRQKPWEKPEFALVLVGPKGVGKTFLMDIIKVLIDGKQRHLHCYKTSNPQDIFGDYRSQLLNLIGLLLEEVTWGGDKKHENMLNDLISGKTITINIKFGPVITVSNLMRIIMGANPGWTVPASHDERRYTIAQVSDAHQQDHSYFKAIQYELDNGGYEAIMYELMTRDISQFNCREALITDALIDQKEKSMPDVERWWLNILRSGKLKFVVSQSDDKEYCVNKEILHNDYIRFMRKISVRSKLLQPDEFAIKLRSFLPKIENGKIIMGGKGRPESIIGTTRIGKEKLYCHLMPSLQMCRDLMDFRLKRKLEWEEPNEWELDESELMG